MRAPIALGWLCVVAAALAGQAADEAAEPMRDSADRFGLQVRRDAPITISADELEARRDDNGQERVLFQKNVRVEQGELVLECDWLQALYPQGAGGRPDQILARGNVRIRQDATEVRCTQAVFADASCEAVCTSEDGSASVQRGESVIEGDRIALNLCSGVLNVRKGRVRLPGSEAERGLPLRPAAEPRGDAAP